jgi:hypothetical protein
MPCLRQLNFKHHFVVSSCFVVPPYYVDIVPDLAIGMWCGNGVLCPETGLPSGSESAFADCCCSIGVKPIPIIIVVVTTIAVALEVNCLFTRFL